MRKRIFEIVELAKPGDVVSAVYDSVMMLLILVSLVPLAFKTEYPILGVIDNERKSIAPQSCKGTGSLQSRCLHFFTPPA